MSLTMDTTQLTVHFKVDVTRMAIRGFFCVHHTSVHKLVLCSDLVYHQGSWIFKFKVSVLVESVKNFAFWSWVKPGGHCNALAVAVIMSLYPHRPYLFATSSIVPGQSDSGAVVTHHDNSWVQRLFSEGKGCKKETNENKHYHEHERECISWLFCTYIYL